MKDKIYQDMHSGHFNYVQIHEDDAEYIRKKALLELLKPEHDIAYCEDYRRGCIDGRNALRKELIDKLNSM